ncbi:receptor like protein 27-like [Euphorbia lathyris]|uniref:receptor like protein 27-like n=1 Tax=Euphorbia lathyris TaxID=212925 RepID=UPI003313ED8E
MRILFSLLVWFLPVVLLSIDSAMVSGVCQSDQQSLLLQLNNTLSYNHSKSTKLVRWNSSLDCCNWPGVSCDQTGLGRVLGLNLSNESISGGIEKSQLFRFQYLQNLDLSYNKFNASLPTGFENLTSLISLNLSNAGFVGQIPMEISYMTELVTLDLSMLSGILFSGRLKLENPNFATLVKKLSKLEELYLDGVNISASGNEWCKALSSSLPKLQVLSMSNCFLSGPFHPSLKNLRFLRVIHLDGNNFSDSVQSVPEFFADFTNLRVLHLSSCYLKGTFPEKILQASTLESIVLSLNQELQGQLPDEFQNASLKTLVLSNTNFSGRLPESIGALGNLTRIELEYCNFFSVIPSSMVDLTELTFLDFSFNNFTGQIPSLVRSRKLMYIDFSHNNLSGEIQSAHFEGLESLVHLDLRNNLLSGSLPRSLFAIPSLQKIFLSSNQFGGQIPDFSDASFYDLDTLDMSSNRLEGPIPRSLFNLTRLSVLLLSSNMLNGTIKLDWILRLSNLTTIDLSFNNLEVKASSSNSASALPYSPQLSTIKLANCSLKVFPYLKNQSKLVYLDLSKNQINGTVPQWIGGLNSLLYLNLSWNLLVNLHESLSFPNLSILDLQHNSLQGSIPTPPAFAVIVDYSNNNFTSFISPDIGRSLLGSIFVSLAKNKLVGPIPESLCNASYLQVLDLSDNSLTGSIPSCLIGISKTLGVLNLRGNRFFGAIPDQFPSNCSLKTLDVNGNKIDGKLPRSLANCTMLEVLDLGNNGMKDSFPCLLKNMTNLRVLVLRKNRFFGNIGCPINHGPWPRLQIVDLASNNFSGGLPDKCLDTWEAMKGSGNELHRLGLEFLQLSGLYYQDSVIVTSKGLQMQLVKILTVFTSIDFSNNNFEGPIPGTIAKFSALYVLNLSRNALTGQISPSLSNLSQLESLDISDNQLTGPIPSELVDLTFLSFLDLSYNQLVGSIPTGNQFKTFENISYQGNVALCGYPLSKSCSSVDTLPPDRQSDTPERNGYNWEFIVPSLGFGAGAAAVVSPLLFWKKAHKWYDDRIDKLLMVILPIFGLVYYRSDDWRRVSPEDNLEEDSTETDIDEGEYEHGIGGRYCVFCTKLDMTRNRVIHDTKCTCYHSPRTLSSSSSSCFLCSDSL